MAVCPNCGALNNDGSKFCTSCGGPLPVAQPAPQPAAQPAPQASVEIPNPQNQYWQQPAQPQQAQVERTLHGRSGIVDNRLVYLRSYKYLWFPVLTYRTYCGLQEERARQGQGYRRLDRFRRAYLRPGSIDSDYLG